jgi:hypothetical protein
MSFSSSDRSKKAFRRRVLKRHGAGTSEIDELLKYGRNRYELDDVWKERSFPPPDEPFVEVWKEYRQEAQHLGTDAALKKRLVQLRFPVEEDISETAAYRTATRSLTETASEPVNGGIQFDQPDMLDLTIHPTPAGRIPVLTADARSDFVRLVQALTRKNEPEPIPDSMGAVMVSGYRNWDRIQRLRENCARKTEGRYTDAQWTEDFRSLQSQRERYQDCFILLSSGPYSGVPAEEMDLDPKRWKQLSHCIRQEHESAHYFTRRVFGSMQNTLHDELLADYHGIATATGSFDADWFLHFMGLEDFPSYREGGRLENYCGPPLMSGSSFQVVKSLVFEAAKNIKHFDQVWCNGERSLEEQAEILATMAQISLEALASAEAGKHLLYANQQAKRMA